MTLQIKRQYRTQIKIDYFNAYIYLKSICKILILKRRKLQNNNSRELCDLPNIVKLIVGIGLKNNYTNLRKMI
jgi:hypothetical protein